MADDLLPGEEHSGSQERDQLNRIRTVVADTYTFVRSREINRTISSFTFDHYIDEAKRQIKGEGRAIRDASGEAFDVRPTKLELLGILETEFRESLEVARGLAERADIEESQ